MRHQTSTPRFPKPIKFSWQKTPSHFLDADGNVWWLVGSDCAIYGRQYKKGWYLKEPTWSIGNDKFTMSQLKEAAGVA